MVRQAFLLGNYSENRYFRITFFSFGKFAFKEPTMLPNKSVTHYTYSKVCSLLFLVVWDLNRLLTLNTILSPPL